MATGKNSFLLYCDITHTVKKLSREQKGDLFQHILDYVNDENPQTNDMIIELVFEPIKQSLKRSLDKWNNTVSQRVESGRIGGLKSGEVRRKQNEANKANASNSKQNEANEAVSDSVPVIVPVIKKVIKKRAEKVFVPPTVDEVKLYFNENGYSDYLAEKFFNSYSVANWINSVGKAVLNWKQTAVNNWFKEENKIKVKSNAADGRPPRPSLQHTWIESQQKWTIL